MLIIVQLFILKLQTNLVSFLGLVRGQIFILPEAERRQKAKTLSLFNIGLYGFNKGLI